MKRNKVHLPILFFMVLSLLAGCSPANGQSADAGSAASNESQASQDPPSSVVELPGGTGEPAPSGSSEADESAASDPTEREIRVATIEKLLETVEQETCVRYGVGGEMDRVELLHDWVSRFQVGQPTQPLYLYHEGIDWGWLTLLEYEGGSRYRVTDCVTGESLESAVVVKRVADYVFCSDLSQQEYMEKAQRYLVRHTPLEAEPMEYDLLSSPPLGAITAEEACRLAILHNSRSLSYFYMNGYLSYSGSGRWIPSSWEPYDPITETSVATITGAVELMGTPCYLITVECVLEDGVPAMNDLAVSADGRLIFSDHKIVGGGYSLDADYGEQYLLAAQ